MSMLYIPSCQKEGGGNDSKSDDANYQNGVAPVETVNAPKFADLNQPYHVEVEYWVSCGCCAYATHETVQNGNEYKTTLYESRPKNAICTMVMRKVDTTLSFTFNDPGIKVLRFAQSDGFTTDTVIAR